MLPFLVSLQSSMSIGLGEHRTNSFKRMHAACPGRVALSGIGAWLKVVRAETDDLRRHGYKAEEYHGKDCLL